MDIFSIIGYGNLEGVKQWLKTVPDINEPNNDG
jgi:hypothetical protein